MRAKLALWLAVAAVGSLAIVWTMAQVLSTPFTLPRATPPAATATRSVPAPSAGRGPWQDPSVPPEVLARAFAPPPADLPPEALPKPLRTQPPREEWQRLQSEGIAAY
jgi:hypothetical protein